jgi:hypothetical protein
MQRRNRRIVVTEPAANLPPPASLLGDLGRIATAQEAIAAHLGSIKGFMERIAVALEKLAAPPPPAPPPVVDVTPVLGTPTTH